MTFTTTISTPLKTLRPPLIGGIHNHTVLTHRRRPTTRRIHRIRNIHRSILALVVMTRAAQNPILGCSSR